MIAGRAAEPQALELIGILQKAGADVNVVALVNHPRGDPRRHGAALRRPQALQGGHQAARLVRHRHERGGSGRPDRAGLHAVPRLHAVHGAADAALQGGGDDAPRAGRDQADGRKAPCGRSSVHRRASGRTSFRWASRRFTSPSTSPRLRVTVTVTDGSRRLASGFSRTAR